MKNKKSISYLLFLLLVIPQLALAGDLSKTVLAEIKKGHSEVWNAIMKYGPAKRIDAYQEAMNSHREDQKMESPFWIGYFFAIWESEQTVSKVQNNSAAIASSSTFAIKSFKRFRHLQKNYNISDDKLLNTLGIKKSLKTVFAQWDQLVSIQ